MFPRRSTRVRAVREEELLGVLAAAADAVSEALERVEDWDAGGTREGQYGIDLVADAAAVEVLEGAGLGVLSEESGLHGPERQLLAVLDPLDGSTNASRRIPWYATSICVLDDEGPRVALVADQAGGSRYEAVRGAGATHDGSPISPSGCSVLAGAVVGVSGYPPRRPAWLQFRALGAAALDMCLVARGSLDAFWNCGPHLLGPWDYLGATLVCREAGAEVIDRTGLDLVARDPRARRSPVAAASGRLLGQLLADQGDPPGPQA